MLVSAIVAAGVALVPASASAAGAPGTATKSDAPSASALTAASTFKTFTSAASNTARVEKGAVAAPNSSSAAPAPAASGDPDPGFTIGLSATGTSAYSIDLTTTVSTAVFPLNGTVNWGDGTSGPLYFSGAVPAVLAHSYAKLGQYNVSVVLTDNNAVVESNSVMVSTPGSQYTPYGPTRLLDTRDGTGAPAAKVPSYGITRVQVAGNGAIPSKVTAVVLNVTVTNPTNSGFITAYADGTARPTTSNVNFTAGQTVPNMAIVPVGADGYVDLYNSGLASVDLIADVTGYFTQSSASGYTSLTPTRIVDTRDGTGTGSAAQVPGLGAISAQVAGNAGVPASGATAVALNVTVTNPRSDGFLTAFPDGQATPNASNVNYLAGQTIANSVVVPIGADGKIDIHNGGGLGADVVIDVVGYYSPASKSSYLPIKPTRLLDTRDPSWPSGPLDAGQYIYMPLSDTEPDITGFVLNTTVTNTRGGGFLTVSPDPNTLAQYGNNTASASRPNSSVLNWLPGQTVPNLVQAGTGGTGIIDFWNTGSGTTDLVVDAFGFYQND
ncbi:hypothetical protein [Kitasatospora mediocidica]|uniref:hypothetical protein n=1 Tax=Kitasatospora mediocidica TaxID=58352 RepID=UPI0007C63B71|nr:hypothetical protein [Kitasatospora mediocidica]